MRFSFLALAAIFAFATAAPTPASTSILDISKRLPTPEEFETLSPIEKRKVYHAWYRATNILPATDDDESVEIEKRKVYQAWYRATNILPATDEEDIEKRKVYHAWYRATNILPAEGDD